MTNAFQLEAYDYSLPSELIAQAPVEPRDESRLLVVDRKSASLTHAQFKDLPKILPPHATLIANDSRVFPARLLGQRILEGGTRGGKTEFFLLEEKEPRVWSGLFHAAAKHKPGVRFAVVNRQGEALEGVLIRGASESPHGIVWAEFNRDPRSGDWGEVPLPPYIEARNGKDRDRYQTVYAKREGSSAAPTAGMHFTQDLIARLRAAGMKWEELTLHVGLGTFRPIKSADIREHKMHEERFHISEDAAQRLERCRAEGRPCMAVGTTTVRALESAWDPVVQHLRRGWQATDLFLYPGGSRSFAFVNGMITNFHLPKSSLLVLVCAFAGRDLILKAYEEAIRQKYRFYSYGDAMLIL